MKLPYNPNHCFYLESMKDVKLFNTYISRDLDIATYRPLEWFRLSIATLPQYVYLRLNDFGRITLWENSAKLPPNKFVVTLDALSNPEQYPELFI